MKNISAVASAILLFIICTSCTKTEDYLRQKVVQESSLIDPSSAIFRNVKYSGSVFSSWCGEINAKNRMGGYGGWKKFAVTVYDSQGAAVDIYDDERANSYSTGAVEETEDETKRRVALENTMNEIRRIAYRRYQNCENSKPASSYVPFWR